MSETGLFPRNDIEHYDGMQAIKTVFNNPFLMSKVLFEHGGLQHPTASMLKKQHPTAFIMKRLLKPWPVCGHHQCADTFEYLKYLERWKATGEVFRDDGALCAPCNEDMCYVDNWMPQNSIMSDEDIESIDRQQKIIRTCRAGRKWQDRQEYRRQDGVRVVCGRFTRAWVVLR